MNKKHISILLALVALVAGASVFATSHTVSGEEAASDPGAVWAIRCSEAIQEGQEARGRCEIYQRLVVQETKQRLVEFAIGFPDEKESARGIVVLPLGILLQPGVEMRVDDGAPFKFQARFCDPSGCHAFVTLNQQVLDSMRKGSEIIIGFKSAQGQDMNVKMSLKGFTEQLREIS